MFEWVPNKSGIYEIRNSLTQDSYVGQSCAIRDRLRGHFNLLFRVKHPNKKLQSGFAKSPLFFIARVLELCEGNFMKMNDRERYWVKTVPGTYNIASIANTFMYETPRGWFTTVPPEQWSKHSDLKRFCACNH